MLQYRYSRKINLIINNLIKKNVKNIWLNYKELAAFS